MLITNVTGNYFLKQNDTATEIHLAVQEVDGTPVDLSTATRLEVVIGTLEGRVLTKTPTVLQAPGEFTFGLDEGDMLPVGDNLLELYIYTQSGEKRVAPSKGHYKLRVQQSLGELGLVVTTYTLDYFLSEVNRITYGLPELILRAETTANILDEFLETTDQLHAETVETLGRANSAVETVNNAADRAETAIVNADTATNNANTAATAANDAKTAADTATSNANTAASNADAKATLAQNAANAANTAKESADTATSAANTATQNANTATTAANNIKDELSGLNIPISDFVLATSYLKHQPVFDSGNTYRAKKATQGNPLPVAPARENEWWVMEAQKGLDGKGAVVTVSNKQPDAAGNIALVKSDVGLGNVDNTSDVNKPVSTAQRTAIDLVQTDLNTHKTDYGTFKTGVDTDLTTLKSSLATGAPTTKPLVRGANVLEVATKALAAVKRVDGKTIVNLAPLFDSGVWKPVGTGTIEVLAPNRVKITSKGTGLENAAVYEASINIKPNTDYYLDFKPFSVGNYYIDVQTFNSAGTRLNAYWGVREAFTFRTHADAVRVSLSLTTKESAIFTFENVSLVEGTQAQPFVANVKGLTNPTITNETNGTSLVVPTTLYDGEYVEQNAKGELVKHKKFAEFTLDDSLTYEHFMNRTGFKEIRVINVLQGAKLPTLQVPYQPQKVVKYNGQVLLNADTYSNTGVTLSGRSDVTYFDHLSKPNTILFTIANTDSGWGPNYTPMPEELKAFLLGWRMRNSADTSPYTGTGTKYWATVASNGLEHATSTLPTTLAPTHVNDKLKWQPNRLIYELATPVQEVIRPVGNLSLNSGDNSLTVKEGRIVNEIASIQEYAGNMYVNGSAKPLKFRVSHILRAYRQLTQTSYETMPIPIDSADYRIVGAEYLKLQSFDPTAVYTVDYDPLYVWEVSAPFTSADIEYRSNLGSVVENLVGEVADNTNEITQLQNNVVFKNEGINWIKPTLLNGWTGEVRYGKDSLGNVHIRGNLSGGAQTNYTTLFILPPGFRPTKDHATQFRTTSYDGINTPKTCEISMNGLGTVEIFHTAGWALNFGYFIFKAEN